jgi:biopolymer transport protein ExbD
MRLRKKHEEREVDLAALIDVMANMIFFLMATVTFLSLRTVNAAVPAMSSGAVDTGKSVDVSLAVTAEGYYLKAEGQSADPRSKPVKIEQKIGRRMNGSLDTRELTKQLWEIKKVASEQKNIIIMPDDSIPFDEVIATMDASREMASIVDPTKRVPLFSRPVLSEPETRTAQEVAAELQQQGGVP